MFEFLKTISKIKINIILKSELGLRVNKELVADFFGMFFSENLYGNNICLIFHI